MIATRAEVSRIISAGHYRHKTVRHDRHRGASHAWRRDRRSLAVPRRSPCFSDARSWRSARAAPPSPRGRSEEHTSELQSLMRISYAVFCLKKKTQQAKNIESPYTTLSNSHNKHNVNSKIT